MSSSEDKFGHNIEQSLAVAKEKIHVGRYQEAEEEIDNALDMLAVLLHNIGE